MPPSLMMMFPLDVDGAGTTKAGADEPPRDAGCGLGEVAAHAPAPACRPVTAGRKASSV